MTPWTVSRTVSEEAVVAAGPAEHVADGDEGAVRGAGQTLAGQVLLGGHGGDEGGGHAGDGRQQFGAQVDLQCLGQGVVAALGGGAGVFHPVRPAAWGRRRRRSG